MSDFLFLVAIDPNTGAAELCEGGVYSATPPADSEYAGNTLTRATFDRDYYGNRYGHEYELWSDMRGATIDGNVRSSLEDWQLAAAGVAVAPVSRQIGPAVYDPRHEAEPRPTVAESIDYARSILPAGAILCGSVASRVSPTVRDVLFCLAGDRTRRVLSTWFEGSSLYGEW